MLDFQFRISNVAQMAICDELKMDLKMKLSVVPYAADVLYILALIYTPKIFITLVGPFWCKKECLLQPKSLG